MPQNSGGRHTTIQIQTLFEWGVGAVWRQCWPPQHTPGNNNYLYVYKYTNVISTDNQGGGDIAMTIHIAL